jgi:hypothetical protein
MAKQHRVWNVVILSQYTGDIKEYIDTYSNRGHAIAKLKKLVRDAWVEGKNIRYSIRDGRMRGA